jgi:hypothetical protein
MVGPERSPGRRLFLARRQEPESHSLFTNDDDRDDGTAAAQNTVFGLQMLCDGLAGAICRVADRVCSRKAVSLAPPPAPVPALSPSFTRLYCLHCSCSCQLPSIASFVHPPPRPFPCVLCDEFPLFACLSVLFSASSDSLLRLIPHHHHVVLQASDIFSIRLRNHLRDRHTYC